MEEFIAKRREPNTRAASAQEVVDGLDILS